MIRKTLLSFLVLFLAYAVFVSLLGPLPKAAQNQWQDNIIKAQRFMYNPEADYKNIIVGSSLSSKLDMSRFPATYYNLSFSGLGLYDGLNILSRIESREKNVFVEMNVVMRPEDKEFAEALFSPLSYNLQRVFPLLRQQNQPVTIFAAFVKRGAAARTADAGITRDQRPRADSDIFLKMLQFQIESYAHAPDTSLLNKRFEALKRYVTAMEKRQIRVIFYEMPVHERLCSSPLAETIRKSFYHFFPPSQFRYIPMPDCASFNTSDGVHLTSEEAVIYSDYLRDQAEKTNAAATAGR